MEVFSPPYILSSWDCGPQILLLGKGIEEALARDIGLPLSNSVLRYDLSSLKVFLFVIETRSKPLRCRYVDSLAFIDNVVKFNDDASLTDGIDSSLPRDNYRNRVMLYYEAKNVV